MVCACIPYSIQIFIVKPILVMVHYLLCNFAQAELGQLDMIKLCCSHLAFKNRENVDNGITDHRCIEEKCIGELEQYRRYCTGGGWAERGTVPGQRAGQGIINHVHWRSKPRSYA